MQFLFSCSCTLANAAADSDSALPTRVAIKKNSRRDAKQKEVIPLALSDLFQFYKIHQGTVPGYFTRTPQLQIENALFSTSFSLAAM